MQRIQPFNQLGELISGEFPEPKKHWKRIMLTIYATIIFFLFDILVVTGAF